MAERKDTQDYRETRALAPAVAPSSTSLDQAQMAAAGAAINAMRQQEDIVRAAAEAAGNKADETIPGGKYEVDGVLVNANGEPLNKRDRERNAE
ncbi:MAG TPA: hypothetical protein VNM48_03875 [Chloroflexota bacterium]|nr:hypothetical protein [Chloroflexota bacterium]